MRAKILFALAGILTLLPLGRSIAPAQDLQQIPDLIQKGELAQAKTRLIEFLNIYPKHPGALNLLGVVQAKDGEYQEAESSFLKAIAADQSFDGAYLNLGRLYQENSGQDAEALQKSRTTYESLLRFEPASVEGNYQSALVCMRLGLFKESLARLAHLSAEAQGRPQALAVRCADAAGLQDAGQAETLAERLLAAPELAEADVTTILAPLLAQHREGLAAKLLEGLDRRGLSSPASLRQLATLQAQRGGVDQARATLEKVAQREGVSVPLLTEMARLADQQGDHQGALGYLAHARDLEPSNAAVHFFFGMVSVEMNLVQEASTSLQKAVQLNPDNPYYNYALGAVLMNRQNVREAYPYFKKYCALKPQDPRGRLALGSAYFYGHDLDLARQELHSVVKYPETASGAHYFLGRVANQQGKFTEALQELRSALRGNPRYADAYAELGVLHLKLRQYPEAAMALQRALEISPENYLANLNLMILYQRTHDSRAEAQVKRFDELRKVRADREKEFLRTIEVRP